MRQSILLPSPWRCISAVCIKKELHIRQHVFLNAFCKIIKVLRKNDPEINFIPIFKFIAKTKLSWNEKNVFFKHRQQLMKNSLGIRHLAFRSPLLADGIILLGVGWMAAPSLSVRCEFELQYSKKMAAALQIRSMCTPVFKKSLTEVWITQFLLNF